MSALAAAMARVARNVEAQGHVIDVTAGTPADARWCEACQKHRRQDTEELCPSCLDNSRRGR